MDKTQIDDVTTKILDASKAIALIFLDRKIAKGNPDVFSERLPARPCKGCDVVGKRESYGSPGTYDRCTTCNGLPLIGQPDWSDILKRCLTFRGAVRWRTSNPSLTTKTIRGCHRAGYVWRMVRFYAGTDVCLPMMAGIMSRNDPWLDEMDAFAHGVAAVLYPASRGIAGVARWGGLLSTGGLPSETLDTMPMTASPNGPVITEDETDED
jgi:hypothetical protein